MLGKRDDLNKKNNLSVIMDNYLTVARSLLYDLEIGRNKLLEVMKEKIKIN